MFSRNDLYDDKLKKIIGTYDAVLYIKGEKNFPLCGFSACSISILKQYDVTMLCENVLKDFNFYEWLKEKNNWPILPQIYLFGEFIGGYDILKYMHESGQLHMIIEREKKELRSCIA